MSAARAAIAATAAAVLLAGGLLLAALLAGAVGGVAVAWFSLRHTKFEMRNGAQVYVPNWIIGLALSLLLLSRMAWRFSQMYPLLAAQGTLPTSFNGVTSPLTAVLLGIVLAYHAAYSIGVLHHPARPAPAGPRLE